ncbi:MAG: hypothetical protein HQM06_02000 [Magnetococcales bacterium]|nr:hypothetical protein [Magnetococcales bacterium]
MVAEENKVAWRLAERVVHNRIAQMMINERIKQRAFKVPVHLAMGHEAIAVAVAESMLPDDALCLTHRNIHYNLARADSLRAEIDELSLLPSGLAGGWLGSMNMANPRRGIPYTSSILGNSLSVAAGISLADRLRGAASVTVVVTGDGAMEEGAFFETLQFMKSCSLSSLVIVENNTWSLATRIAERRCPIDLDKLAAAFAISYRHLQGNDVGDYYRQVQAARQEAIAQRTPVLLEVQLTTLGSWLQPTPEFPEGKFINYHHGAAPKVALQEWPVLEQDAGDPLFVLAQQWDEAALRDLAETVSQRLAEEVS